MKKRRWASFARAKAAPPTLVTSKPTVHIWAVCSARAEGRPHECMATEHRCTYCGLAIEAYGCNGCGRFLSSEELHEGETRCEDCR